MNNTRLKAFTFIEFLVVVAILAILMALFMPAISAALTESRISRVAGYLGVPTDVFRACERTRAEKQEKTLREYFNEVWAGKSGKRFADSYYTMPEDIVARRDFRKRQEKDATEYSESMVKLLGSDWKEVVSQSESKNKLQSEPEPEKRAAEPKQKPDVEAPWNVKAQYVLGQSVRVKQSLTSGVIISSKWDQDYNCFHYALRVNGQDDITWRYEMELEER